MTPSASVLRDWAAQAEPVWTEWTWWLILQLVWIGVVVGLVRWVHVGKWRDDETEEPSQMENQHRQIQGYRELTQAEIDQMNRIKMLGGGLGELVEELLATPGVDQRWVRIGQTHLQQGLMALTRAVARPDGF